MKPIFSRDRWWGALVTVLVVLVVWAVVVSYQRISTGEQQQNASKIESDLFWFEQTLNAEIEASQRQVISMIGQVQQSGASTDLFATKSAAILSEASALTNIEWFDVNGVLLNKAVGVFKNATQAPVTRSMLEEQAITNAHTQNIGFSVGTFLMNDGDYEITVVRPVFNSANQLSGFIACQYSLRTLFGRVMPTWFTGKYYTSVYDRNERIYSTENGKLEHFDALSPITQREMHIGNVALLMKAQLRPDNQMWVMRALFLGLAFLMLLLLVSLVALVLDMRRRRRTEKQLAVQNSLRQAIEASLSVGIRGHLIDGTIIYVNPSFCKMIGYTEEEVLNIPPPLPYLPKEESLKVMAARDELLKTGELEVMVEVKMRKKNGEMIDTIMRGGPMFDENHVQTGWITSVEDVTVRKRLEEFQANEQKRLENVNHLISMGEMASSIAHELNQPLSAISGYATGLSNYIQKDDKVLSRERLIDVTEKIRRQAERAANVTRRVQQFAKQQSIAPTHIAVPELIEQVIEFMELELRQKKCAITNHSKNQSLPSVYIDNTMAQQILINIIRNAIDAMVDSGVEERRIEIYVERYSAHHLVIGIFDTGPGVPADKLETIFDAFYTTKTQGVGIGLNICRTMIESNGGRLWAKADANGGAFYLTIPMSQTEVESK